MHILLCNGLEKSFGQQNGNKNLVFKGKFTLKQNRQTSCTNGFATDLKSHSLKMGEQLKIDKRVAMKSLVCKG